MRNSKTTIPAFRNTCPWIALGYLLCVLLLVTGCSPKRYTEPLSPEEALKSFRLNEDFDIEIFAAEPYVMDPVDLVFDEQGNAYVVEMPDYPYEAEKGKATGRIRLLLDSNGDGRIDRSTVFADSLSEATSILPWKGGMIVTAAPEILYLKDTNGDFKADTKEVLFAGFFSNNSEAQITSLRFSIDNWIYANNHGQEGTIHFSGKANAEPVSVRGADFRFRLDRGLFEPETGPGQFGQVIDQWGHRFINENSAHVQQVVIPWRYLHRHPYLPSTRAVVNISDHDPLMFQETPPPYWRAERTRRRNKQFQEQKLSRVEYAEDHFTGAAGTTIYTGDAFPEEYYGNIFTGDVAGNLVHRDLVTLARDSTRFVAKRAGPEKESEFLSSKDPWFRPANITVGPDGYLYVIDMYRQHIETPVSIPEDLKTDMDFLRGSDYGRIYRIVPKRRKTGRPPAVNLKNMQADKLVHLLASSNEWMAIQSQKILLERNDASVVPEVKKMFVSNRLPAARLHALFVLEGLHALDAYHVEKAIKDSSANLRKNGLILAERFQQLLPLIVQATRDSIALVALQATLSLGEFKTAQLIPVFAAVLEKHISDVWFRTAVLSTEAGSSLQLLQYLVSKELLYSTYKPGAASFLRDLSYVAGARNSPGEVSKLLMLVTSPGLKNESRWQLAVLNGLAKGISKFKVNPLTDERLKEQLATMEQGGDKEIAEAVKEVKRSSQQ